MAKFINQTKYRLHFDTGEFKIFTLDEILQGSLYHYCESMGNKVIKRECFSYYADVDGVEIFEGDKVIVVSSNRKREYETEVIASEKGLCRLGLNKTIFIEDVAVACIKKVIK